MFELLRNMKHFQTPFMNKYINEVLVYANININYSESKKLA